MTKAIIIGYGRAGKRHEKYLKAAGVEVDIYDPILFQHTPDLGKFLEYGYDIAVIATPPYLHLAQIKQCLEHGVKAILCEKPLCDFGQIEEAKNLLRYHGEAWRVGVSFNYRWHPWLAHAYKVREAWQNTDAEWTLYSRQYRADLPEWGLLLDHCSHGLDTLRWLGGEVSIETATHYTGEPERWILTGSAGTRKFTMVEEVWRTASATSRESFVRGPISTVFTAEAHDVDVMYKTMWKAFLEHYAMGTAFPVGLDEAIKTQRLLEEVKAL